MGLVLTNQSALIMCRIATLLKNLLMTSAPENVYKHYCFSFAVFKKPSKNTRERPSNRRFVGAKQPIPMGSTGALTQFL